MINAFDWREHRDSYVEVDKDIALSQEMFSMSAINPFIEHNSSPRSLMMNSHISQLIVLNESEENMIQTGVESELSKYTVSKKLESDSEVITVIKRYNMLGEPDKAVGRLVITRNLETGELDATDIPYYNAFHPYFGFKYKVNESLDSMVRGDVLPKDTILASPPTVLDNGGYGFGRDVQIASMTLPEVDEDGFVVSRSFCNKFRFKIFDTRTIEVGENSYLLNMYGDENDYKPFPEIGDYINDTGVVAVARKYDPMYAPALYSTIDNMEFNPLFDEAVYARPGTKSKVVDVKIYKSHSRKRALPTDTDKYCDKYSDALLAYYRQVIETYESANKEYNRTFGRDVAVSNKYNMLLVEAYGIIDSSNINSVCKKMNRKQKLDLYRIEITLESSPTIGTRMKFSGLHGDKGTIVEVWEDEDMPVDADGNRAEMIMDPKSTIGRLNVGRLYERYTKAGMVKVKKVITDAYKMYNVNDVYDLDNDKLITLFKHVVDFTDILGSDLAPVYRATMHNEDREGMISVLEETIEDKFKTYLTIDNDKRKYEIVEDIKNSIYCPPHGSVKFNYNGEVKHTVDNILIAPMYIIQLSKIADTVLACNSAKLNHFGIPIVTSKADRNRLPYKNSPVRTQGETEGRIYVSYGGREFLSEVKDLNTSIKSHSLAYKKLITSDSPTNIPRVIDRDKVPYGGERGLTIIRSLWNSVGMELGYVKETNTSYGYVKHAEVINKNIMDMEDVVDVDLTNEEGAIND